MCFGKCSYEIWNFYWRTREHVSRFEAFGWRLASTAYWKQDGWDRTLFECIYKVGIWI
jgi:hypothetical protein